MLPERYCEDASDRSSPSDELPVETTVGGVIDVFEENAEQVRADRLGWLIEMDRDVEGCRGILGCGSITSRTGRRAE